MKRGLVLLSVASLVLAGVASAAVKQGDTELDLLAGFSSENGAQDNGNSTSLYGEIGLGYFVTDNVQVGASIGASWMEEDGVGSSDDGYKSVGYALGISGKYHFMPTNQWVPYIGARIGYAWDDTDYDDSSIDDSRYEGVWYGPLVGLRFELNENNDFFAEYRYTLYGSDYNDWYDETHDIVVGIIHQFK
jgi:outer membrane autotransporter protein